MRRLAAAGSGIGISQLSQHFAGLVAWQAARWSALRRFRQVAGMVEGGRPRAAAGGAEDRPARYRRLAGWGSLASNSSHGGSPVRAGAAQRALGVGHQILVRT